MAIKHSPGDFVVEEVVQAELLQSVTPTPAEGALALYLLRKEGLATPEATAHIARTLQLRHGAVAYGGLKDKHARTSQHVTIKFEGGAGAAPEQSAGPGWSLERLGFVTRNMTPGDIAANRFQIALRNLSPEACRDMDEAVALLSPGPGGPRVVNYFGDQRFGSARHHRGFMARFLIKGDFEGALKLAIATEARKDRMDQKIFKRTIRENWGRWREMLPRLRPCPERKAVERLANSSGDFRAAFTALPYLLQQLAVYAYQSHLWNAIVRKLVEARCAPCGPVLEVDDPFGQMLFPSVQATPDELVGIDVPLLARKTVLAEPWKSAAETVLKEEGIALEELQIPGVRRPFFGEELRPLFVTATGFGLTAPAPDETARDPRRLKRQISFTLPRGAYATVVLRALAQ